MFTIKSISNEGMYYLVKNWDKQKTFWKTKNKLSYKTDLYNTESSAKASMTKLLKVMEEYAEDRLYLIEMSDKGEEIRCVAFKGA